MEVVDGLASALPLGDGEADAVVFSLVLCAMRRVQRALDATLWPRLFGSCHTSRDTASAVEQAGPPGLVDVSSRLRGY